MPDRRFVLLGLTTLLLPAWSLADSPQSILFVGNSYFYYNDGLHHHLKQLLEAAQAQQSRSVVYKSATIGGARLDHHPIEWLTAPGRLGVTKPFDVVILAGNSTEALRPASRERFRQTAIAFDRTIRARGSQTVLYMTPAHVAPSRHAKPGHQQDIADMYQSVGQEIDAKVLPVGLAFAESYKRRPDILLHNAHDGSHPSLYGTYLAACVLLAQLYGLNPIGNTYSAHGQVPHDVMTHLQQVAWDSASAHQASAKDTLSQRPLQ